MAIQENSHVRFVVLGDVEPKPEPVFTNLENAVNAIHSINETFSIDFVASIGDIARNGTLEQYEGATHYLTQLKLPLFVIMGNEEMVEGEKRFLEYAAKWNESTPELRFVKTFGRYAFIFATASIKGLEFTDQDIHWLTEQIQQNSDKTVILFTHAPAQDVFAGARKRVIPNEEFKEILRHPNVRLHFSGHVHMDLDSVVTYVTDENRVHHVHAPSIERTKVGESHTPRLRVVTLETDGSVDIQSYNLDKECFEEKHRIRFSIDSAA